MAEVARVADHLDIFVHGRNRLQHTHGIVLGGVVDKNVLVAIIAKRGYGRTHALVDFADVQLFVIAGGNDADGFHVLLRAVTNLVSALRSRPVPNSLPRIGG